MKNVKEKMKNGDLPVSTESVVFRQGLTRMARDKRLI